MSRPEGWSRRNALLSVLAAMLAPNAGWALGKASQLDVAELMLDRNTLSRPGAWQRVLFEVSQSTSIEANPQTVVLSPEDPALFEHPFCVLTGDGPLPPLTDTAAAQLHRYLSYGGFLFIDDATASPNGEFSRSVRQMVARLFPTRPLSPLPTQHSVFRSFFLLDVPFGRTNMQDYLEGVTVGPITPLVYCANDLSGALDRGPDGRDRYPVVPGGNWQRREALKLAINLVLYSLTSNYKHDQAHVAELMREGRLE
ncbi:MAG: DUF4159 domain-containing protein [Myxococcota bacterium]